MRPIDADPLYEQLKEEEDKARERVINTPSSLPDGRLNPQAINFLVQLTKITWLKKLVYDAPTITSKQKGGWFILEDSDGTRHKMRIDKDSWAVLVGEDTE